MSVRNIKPVNYLETVNFKAPLTYNEKTKRFAPISWKGWILRLIPFVDSFQDQKIMRIMLKHMGDKSLSLKERMQWASAAKKFEKNVLGKYRFSIPNSRRYFSQEIYLSTLEEMGLPKDISKKYPAFVKFIKINHLDKMMKNQKHHFEVDEATLMPMMLVEGRYRNWDEIKTMLGVNEYNLSIKDKGWSYLGESDFGNAGLVKYDSEKWEVRPGETEPKPRPYRKLSQEEISNLKDGLGRQIELPYIENYVDCRAEAFPHRCLENNDHSFKKMIDKDGNVYFFGFSPKEEKTFFSEVRNALASHKAVIESPDHFADVPAAYRMSEIKQMSQRQFDDAFHYMTAMHNLGVTYNVFNNNCLELIMGADQYAGVNVPANKELKIKFHKIFPRPFQFIYQWTPLPRFMKRFILRSIMNFAGFDKGEKVGGFRINAKSESSVWKDIKISHPRCYLQYLKKQKALKNPNVFVHS